MFVGVFSSLYTDLNNSYNSSLAYFVMSAVFRFKLLKTFVIFKLIYNSLGFFFTTGICRVLFVHLRSAYKLYLLTVLAVSVTDGTMREFIVTEHVRCSTVFKRENNNLIP